LIFAAVAPTSMSPAPSDRPTTLHDRSPGTTDHKSATDQPCTTDHRARPITESERGMPTTITTIRTIAIPAQDQDRTVAFFVGQLGFEPRLDAELTEGFRWIEVAPPGSAVSVAIVAASPQLPAGIDTGIRFVTTDAEAEHAAMQQHGVDVDEIIRWPEAPAMFSFRDIDGNTYYLAEPGL
jgi:catechol 2,3-dioxygenase-like lactoylglutathione lyase family enzyme